MGNSYGSKIVTDDLILCLDTGELNPTHAKFNTNDIVTELAFASPGGSNEELKEVGKDPWGKRAVLDRSINNDTTSNYDGGDTSNVYSITSSVKYRYTYFFRVDKKGSGGTLYFGLYGYNSSSTNIAIGGTTNPYFSYVGHNHSYFQEGRWYMLVTYVHPAGTSNPSDSTAGFYDMVTKAKISNPSSGNVTHNPVWDSTHTKAQFRYYLYYSTDPTVEMSWYQARIEPVNGSEPSITNMLNQCPDRLVNLAGDGYAFHARNSQSYESTYKSITFNGSTQCLDAGTDITFKTSGGWTVSSWVKYDNVPASYNNTTAPGNFIGAESIAYNSWYWSVLSGKLALWDLSPGSVWKYGATTLSADTWYHATLVSNSNNTHYYCYLNGEDDMSSSWSSYNGSWQSSKAGLKIRYIGKGSGGNPRMVDGNIAATQAWSRALTAAEIKSNFSAQKSRFGL